jgi:hypothetical protein
MEDLVEPLTRGNVAEVKVLLASIALALAVYQLGRSSGSRPRRSGARRPRSAGKTSADAPLQRALQIVT